MNNKLYKKLVIAMMITTISTVAVASADDSTASVRPVDLSQADAVQARAKAEDKEIKAQQAQQKKGGPKPKPSSCESGCAVHGYYAGNA